MNRCSGCGYIVPASWTECRRCGTPIGADAVAASAAPLAAAATPAPHVAARNGFAIPPPPPSTAPVATASLPSRPDAAFGAPDDAIIAGARPRGVVPDTMLPTIDPIVTQTKARIRRSPRNIAIVVLSVLIVAFGIYSLLPGGGSHKKLLPTILAPRTPAIGIDTNLEDMVRIAAESARHTALGTVIDAAGNGTPLTLAQLAAAQPDYQWIAGDQPSTTNTIISITSGAGIDVIAVSGTDRDICAFGRWSATTGSDYVTMAHVTNCSATNAPATGWSTLPGGSAQDLPNVDGG